MKAKRIILALTLTALTLLALTACDSKSNTDNNDNVSQYSDNDQQDTPSNNSSQLSSTDSQTSESSVSGKTVPDGDIVKGNLATKENPVPFGTWADLTISDGGWPKPAYMRMVNVISDQTKVQALIDDYNNKNPDSELMPLEEHVEFLDYIVVEYELFFPADFTTSEKIITYIALSRENNQDNWIASDGSNYYWMGSVETIAEPSRETGYPKNGDASKRSIIYPMIKGNTDYTLHYKERTPDLSETIDTYFAIK